MLLISPESVLRGAQCQVSPAGTLKAFLMVHYDRAGLRHLSKHGQLMHLGLLALKE